MSVDKLVDSTQLNSDLTSVANAIRSKTGGSVSLTFPAEFVSAINGIPTGGSLETGSQTITATESSQSITMTPAAGYDGFDEVDITVNAIPSNYVGSGVTQRTSSDLTASGATVTAPAGYYASAASKSVPSGSASTPATTITANPTISVGQTGLITATVSASQSVTPSVSAGYVSSGTAGTVSVSGSNTQQLTAQAAQTITPTTTDQTIASGKYLTGTQTIKGDANLVAANIADGVTIFGVTGTHQGGGGGGGATTVQFGDDSVFMGGYIGYVDGNGTFQTTTTLAMMSAISYQMLSKSVLVWASSQNPAFSGEISGSYTGMTLVGSKTFTASRLSVYIQIFQVD